jgi:hypothetical protein
MMLHAVDFVMGDELKKLATRHRWKAEFGDRGDFESAVRRALCRWTLTLGDRSVSTELPDRRSLPFSPQWNVLLRPDIDNPLRGRLI